MRPLRQPPEQHGFVTTQYVAVISFSLLFLVLLVNFVAFQYGRGAVRAALDEGTRAGSRVTDTRAADVCLLRAQEALDGLLGGSMGDQVSLTCTEAAGGRELRAGADVTFLGWFDPMPKWTFSVQAVAVREQAP
jgi:hypothetical protein